MPLGFARSILAGGAAEPVYTLSASPTSANEGQSTIVTLTTENVDVGTSVPYSITGINSSDLSTGSISGNFVIEAGGADSLTFTFREDAANEGTETMVLAAGGQTVSVSVADTSRAVSYTWHTTPSATPDEGDVLNFVARVYNSNETMWWHQNLPLTDVNPYQGQLTKAGPFTSGSDFYYTHTGSTTIQEDVTTEGNETMLLYLRSGGQYGTIRDTYVMTIQDTSVSNPNDFKVNLNTFTPSSYSTLISGNAQTGWGISGIGSSMLYRAIDGSNDGQYIYVGGITNTNEVVLARYILSTPFNLSTISFQQAFRFPSPTDINIRGMHISANGSYVFIFNGTGGVDKYTLATPFDLSSFLPPYTPQYFSTALGGSTSTYWAGGHFSENGRKFYVATGSLVLHYDLTTPWHLGSASLTNEYAVSSVSNVRDVWLNRPGTQLVISTNNKIRSYDLTTPFDLNSATNSIEKTGFTSSASSPSEFFFWRTGKIFYSDYSAFGNPVWQDSIDIYY